MGPLYLLPKKLQKNRKPPNVRRKAEAAQSLYTSLFEFFYNLQIERIDEAVEILIQNIQTLPTFSELQNTDATHFTEAYLSLNTLLYEKFFVLVNTEGATQEQVNELIAVFCPIDLRSH